MYCTGHEGGTGCGETARHSSRLSSPRPPHAESAYSGHKCSTDALTRFAACARVAPGVSRIDVGGVHPHLWDIPKVHHDLVDICANQLPGAEPFLLRYAEAGRRRVEPLVATTRSSGQEHKQQDRLAHYIDASAPLRLSPAMCSRRCAASIRSTPSSRVCSEVISWLMQRRSIVTPSASTRCGG